MGLNDGLVSLYHFTGNANDSAGSNNGTVTGATLTTDKNSVSNQAYDYSGSGQYISYGTTGVSNSAISISVFFNSDVALTANTGIVGISDGSYSRGMIYINSSGQPVFWLRHNATSTSTALTSSTALSSSTWYHVVGTWDGTTMKLYVNSVQKNTTTYSISGTSNSLPTLTTGRLGTFNGWYFNGKIDEVRIYNRALSDQEVLELYYLYDGDADSYNTLPEDCEAYWTLDNTLSDATGNGYTLTNSGVDITATGKISQCGDWDGTSDYMTYPVGTISTLDSTSSFTFNFWIQFDVTASRQDIFMSSGGTTGTYVPFMMIVGLTSGSVRVFSQKYAVANTYQIDTATSTVTTGTWYMFTITQTSSGYYFYINGSLIGSDTSKGVTGDVAGYDGTLYMGRADSYKFNGKMDEVGIWSRVLTSTEILQLYNGSTGYQYPFSSTPAEIDYITKTGSTTDLTTYTFSSQPLGDADSNRIIIVCATSRSSNGTARTLNSASIGGVSATINTQTTYSGNTNAIFSALVPTGTTGDIVLTWSSTLGNCDITVYKSNSLASTTAYDTLTASNADPLTGTIDIPAGGVCVGIAKSDITGTSAVWTNLNEDYDGSDTATNSMTSASMNFVSEATGLIISCDYVSSARPVMVVASFSPVTGGGYVNKILGYTASALSKVNGVDIANVSKFNGV